MYTPLPWSTIRRLLARLRPDPVLDLRWQLHDAGIHPAVEIEPRLPGALDDQMETRKRGRREIMELTTLTQRLRCRLMTINITPEDEKLIREKLRTGAFRSVEEVIHRALVSLPTPETSPQPARPRRNLVDVLSEPPFAGSELNLERIRDYPRPLDL